VVEIAAQATGVCPVPRPFPWLGNQHREDDCLHLFGAIGRILTAPGECRHGPVQRGQAFVFPERYFPGLL
jgi:hypothetical protein